MNNKNMNNRKEKVIFNINNEKIKKLKFIAFSSQIRGILNLVLLFFSIFALIIPIILSKYNSMALMYLTMFFSPILYLFGITFIIAIVFTNISIKNISLGKTIQKMLKNKKEINSENIKYIIELQLNNSKLRKRIYYIIVIFLLFASFVSFMFPHMILASR